jgi:drug/metabolite transporter (DMT)-like permease
MFPKAKGGPIVEQKKVIGLLAILGVWFTAAFALPLVNLLSMFTPAQLMAVRGFLTAGIILIGLGGVIGRVDKFTYFIALSMPFATLGLFEGIRHWGAGPTIIIITATPLVNLVIDIFTDRRISLASIVGLVLVLGGVMVTRWGGEFSWVGFGWSLFGTVMNGVLYEFFARAKSTPLQKCFFGSLGMGMLGFVLSAGASWAPVSEPKIFSLLLGFGFVGGLLYLLANLLAFENLPTIEASVLAQGETPAVIIGAYILLDERLTVVQWFGVSITLYGAWYTSKKLQLE